MNESSNKRGIAVGIFIIVGLALLVGGVLTIGNLHSTFTRKITVSTVFDDVSGLQAGNNIWFSGVKIGTVKKLEFEGTSNVKVIMNINISSREYIHKDSKVKLSSDGLIGNKILVIYGGSALAPEIEEGDVLSNEHLMSTEDIMNTFQENNLNVLKLTKKLADGEGTLGKLLSSDSVYRSIAATASSLEAAASNAQALIGSLSKFSANLNKEGTLLNDLVSDETVFKSLQASVFQLQNTADTASALVTSLKAASNDPKSPVGLLLHDQEAGADLKSTIQNLENSSKKLDTYMEALQHNVFLRKYLNKEKKAKGK